MSCQTIVQTSEICTMRFQTPSILKNCLALFLDGVLSEKKVATSEVPFHKFFFFSPATVYTCIGCLDIGCLTLILTC